MSLQASLSDFGVFGNEGNDSLSEVLGDIFSVVD